MTINAAPEGDAADRRRLILDVVLLVLLALATRVLWLGHDPHVDEFRHVFAARSLLSDGTLAINGGMPYTRGLLYTYLVAGSFAGFGESLIAARLPALLAGVGLVVAVFLCVRAIGGRLAGWTAGLLVCFDPTMLRLSQFGRFYSLQGLLFWVGSWQIYRMVASEVPARRTLWRIGGALAALGLAFSLQITTAAGLAGLALWVVLAAGPGVVGRIAAHPRRGWIAAGLLAAVLGLAWVAVQAGLPERVIARYLYADLWAMEHRWNFRFYHWGLLLDYPTLWTLFPFALLVVAKWRPAAAGWAAGVFGTAFLLHSFAAWKEFRYFSYAMPFFFAVSGLAVARVVPWLHTTLRDLLTTLAGARVPRPVLSAATVALLVGGGLFTIAGNGAASSTARSLLRSADREGTTAAGRWGDAAPVLAPYADSAAVVVSSVDLNALYYLGRYDVGLHRSDLGDNPEFWISPGLRRPIISEAASLQRLMECYPSGLVVVENSNWRQPWGVPPATADYLEAHAEALELPPEWRLLAFRWGHEVGAPCAIEGIPAHAVPVGASGGT